MLPLHVSYTRIILISPCDCCMLVIRTSSLRDVGKQVMSKASTMKRVIGMTGDIESRWVISCTNRSKLLSEALFMRDAVLGESHDPSVHMALYGKVWDGQPRLHVQLLIRPYSFSISKGDGEVLEDIALFAIQKLRRLGDTPGGFALKYMSGFMLEDVALTMTQVPMAYLRM